MGERAERTLFYDVPAEGYRELYGEEQLKKYGAVFRGLNLDRVDKVLDIGCGIALLRDYLRSLEFRGLYVGLDLLEDRLREARKELDVGSDLVLADAHHLPFRGKSFNLTIMVTVIHLLDIERALSELERVSRDASILTLLKKRIELEEKILKGLARRFSGWRLKVLEELGIKDRAYLLWREPKLISREQDHFPDIASPSQDHEKPLKP